MATTLFHPKNGKRCVLCKRWDGEANIVFKNPHVGYEYTTGVPGKCMKNGSNQFSNNGNSCRDYEPSNEADKLL